MFFGSVDVVIVPSSVSKRQDCLSLREVSHNRPRLVAAARRLTETDATSLRNISGLRRADPASTGPQEEFNKREHIGSSRPSEELDKTEHTRSLS